VLECKEFKLSYEKMVLDIYRFNCWILVYLGEKGRCLERFLLY
jgi:hypothetical protein